MKSQKMAYERLRRANPQPVVHIEHRPDPREIMTEAQLDVPTLAPALPRTRPNSRIGPLVGAAVFALVLALGLPMLLDNETEPTPANTVSEAVPPVTGAGVLVPGTHHIGTIGVPLTFDLPFEWWVESVDPGRTVLADPGGGFDRIEPRRQLTLVRPTALADPTDLSGGVPAQGGWALDDIDGWLDMLEEGVSASEVSSTTVGGYPAIRFILRLDNAYPCGIETCASLLSSRGSGELALRRGTDWLIWWVDLGQDVEPLALVAATAGDDSFRETLEQMVASITLGEPQPHPLETDKVWELGFDADVPAGEVRVPAVGGIRFELPTDQFIFQNEHSLWMHPTGLTIFNVFIAQMDSELQLLETAEDVTDYLKARADLRAIDAGTAAVGPYQGRVYDVTDGPVSTEVTLWAFGEDGNYRIPPPTYGRVWVADTERGPLVVVAGILEGDGGLQGIVDFAEEILPTIELIEAP